MRLASICLFFVAAPMVFAGDTTVVLLPSYGVSVNGANGTLWETELYLVNSSDRLIAFGPCTPAFPPGFTCPPDIAMVFEPHTAYHNPQIGPSRAGLNGVFALIETKDVPDVTLALRLLRDGRAVTALPVVPAEAFAGGTIHLLNVPVGPSQRTTLRLFGLENAASSVRIRTYPLPLRGSQPVGAALTDTAVVLAPSPYTGSGFQFAPSYAEIPLPASPSGMDVPISIDVSVDDGTHIWAYVTAVSNTTDQVLVITPR